MEKGAQIEAKDGKAMERSGSGMECDLWSPMANRRFPFLRNEGDVKYPNLQILWFRGLGHRAVVVGSSP
jgi:hypothetical protein